MELIAQIVNSFESLTIFTITSILYVRLGFEYVSVVVSLFIPSSILPKFQVEKVLDEQVLN